MYFVYWNQSRYPGFPIRGQLLQGNLGKMATNCIKITKTTLLGQDREEICRGQANFLVSKGVTLVPLNQGKNLVHARWRTEKKGTSTLNSAYSN